MAQEGFYSLKGKVAIITGAGQGIGKGIATRFAKAGAKVGVLDFNAKNAEETAKLIGGVSLVGDVTKAEDIKNAVEKMKKEAGSDGIDIVVNCAGVAGKSAYMWELSREDFEKVLAVNLIGPFMLTNAIMPDMRKRKYGRVINVASIAGKEGNPRMVPYSASKAALIGLTKSLAKEVAKDGDITVNSIAPAVVQTPILEQLDKANVDYMISKIPKGRTCKIEEVAALVHFLASQESAFITGQCYDISGGRATY